MKENGDDKGLVTGLAGHMGKAIERIQKEAIGTY